MKPLADRLTEIVARKLEAPVTFNRWQRDERTGADTPVFNVPESHKAQAVALGLTVA